MDVIARMTSKGQLTVPKPVREALGLEPGDRIHFRVHADRAVLAKLPDFLELAGSLETPPEVRDMPWDEVRRQAWTARFSDQR